VEDLLIGIHSHVILPQIHKLSILDILYGGIEVLLKETSLEFCPSYSTWVSITISDRSPPVIGISAQQANS
jgi:hypothetical protein